MTKPRSGTGSMVLETHLDGWMLAAETFWAVDTFKELELGRSSAVADVPNQIESLQYWGHGSPGAVSGFPEAHHRKAMGLPCGIEKMPLFFDLVPAARSKGLRGITYAKMSPTDLVCTTCWPHSHYWTAPGGLHTIGPNAPATWPNCRR